ncbi:DNA replication protein DnaC [Edaphobacillus lindanitolerans]|uniref:DNA replication protein DnaC n=2 Tax=Edaphobacillus lindanitolerans TaxID=550447 RepID=A0A1U7PT72_9BACI|nr:DNA replication protein DnaC [Edaphobacillus lindanitolerans]
MSSLQQNEPSKHGAEYECPQCKDTEMILYIDEDGYSMGRPCECKDRKVWKRRFKNAMIPDEFTYATIENFQHDTDMQKDMHRMTTGYLDRFPAHRDALHKHGMQNFGLVADFGEQRIRRMPDESRTAAKQEHNSFGIGKTHLQIGLCKKLIKAGFNVLVISDVSFMDETMAAKRMSDNGETFHELMRGVMEADVLMWDDIGKAKPSESKEDLYYNVINERYKRKKPIVFSSNEDRGTLADRIGYAAASRLIGQCGDYLLETKGQDWRLKR